MAGAEVERIIHMRTVHLGPEELLVAAKFAVRHDETAADVARGIDAVEARIRAAVPIARVIYLEPDIYSGAQDGCRDDRGGALSVERLTARSGGYAWGSRDRDRRAAGPAGAAAGPEAELWMGAHPASPSRLAGERRAAGRRDRRRPGRLARRGGVARFGPRLPFLLKMLAAAEPLSLQAHPTPAAAGGRREAPRGAPDAPAHYVDPRHKPETAGGARRLRRAVRLPPRRPSPADAWPRSASPALAPVVDALRQADMAAALRGAVSALLGKPDAGGRVAAAVRGRGRSAGVRTGR